MEDSILSIVRLPEVPDDLHELERMIIERESSISNLKPDNEARIVWNNDELKKTKISLVYIHGFSASQGEGAPIHTDIAKRYGFNLFLNRLAYHGIDKDAFKNLTLQDLLNSAAEALAIGEKLGDHIILMGTSTGASLSILLASLFKNIMGVIAYSPIVDFSSLRAKLVRSDFVKFAMKHILHYEYVHSFNNKTPEEEQYWYKDYHVKGLIALNQFVNTYMTEETFKKVTQPFFLGYYYKDKKEHDPTVSVPKMLKMYQNLGTPQDQKRMINFQNAHAHVIGSQYTSDSFYEVQSETINFLEDVLHVEPLHS